MTLLMVRQDQWQQDQVCFYASSKEAELYDRTVELTQPYYQLFMATLVELLRHHFDAWDDKAAAGVDGALLDVGCGTGTEALAAAPAFPGLRIVALDRSRSMLDLCREKLKRCLGADQFKRRCTLVQADLLGPEAVPDRLLDLAAEAGVPRGRAYRVALSAFMLHHFTADEKELAYRRLHAVLEPGGLLLNADLFSFASPHLARQAAYHGEQYICRRFSEVSAKFLNIAGHERRATEQLRDEWLEHYRRYNRPLPMERRPAAVADSEAEGFATETELLEAVGFREFDCPMRYFEAGILWARK